MSKFYGGAIYTYNNAKSTYLINCSFSNNYIKIPNHDEGGFGGGIFLLKGKIERSKFINNKAFNGADIFYEQGKTDELEIIENEFIHDDNFNQGIKSLIKINGIYNSSSINQFSKNKIILNQNIYVFDGEMELDEEHDPQTYKLKFKFNNNCIFPYEEKLFKTNNIQFHDETINSEITFSSAFDSQCEGYTLDPDVSITPIYPIDPSITPIDSTITPTDGPNCEYDQDYTENSIYYFPFCIIRCTFKSIITNTNGGALSIKIIDNPDNRNIIINNCSFENCVSDCGGAIYIYLEKNSILEIINSTFSNNRANSIQGGSLYITSQTRYIMNITNCTIKSTNNCNAFYIEKSNYSIQNSEFNNNRMSGIDSITGSAIYLIESNGIFTECLFDSNYFYNNHYSFTSIAGPFLIIKGDHIFQECKFNNNERSGRKDLYGGSLYISESKYSIMKCIFYKNNAKAYGSSNPYYERSLGGAIALKGSSGMICDCSFINNTSYSQYDVASGGAIYSESTISTFNNCLFINNTASSDQAETQGGSVCFINNEGTFENCTILNNNAYSAGNTYGGSFYFRCQNIIFQNCTISNNDVYSKNNNAFGGAINIESKYITIRDCTFSYNTAISDKTLARGGAIYTSSTKLIYENITFINNSIRTISVTGQGGAIFSYTGDLSSCINCYFHNNSIQINSDKFSADISFNAQGGSFYLESMTLDFINCTFQNNFCLTNASNWDINLLGGAIYTTKCKLKFNMCHILNNNLFSYDKQIGPLFKIQGGAFCMLYTESNFSECEFIDNSISLKSEKDLEFFMSNLYGGAIYSYNDAKPTYLINCLFSNNYIKIPNHDEGGFGGGIFLLKGKIERSEFINNKAFNGADIFYEQGKTDELEIIENEFIHDNNFNQGIKSLIKINGIYNSSSLNQFSKNKIIILNQSIHVFDGEMELDEEHDPQTYKLKFKFNNNCIFPYEEKLFKTNNIQFHDETGNSEITFSSAFDLQCKDYRLPTDYFSKSSIFSYTKDFTMSEEFTKSDQFSNSLKFTSSKEFTLSNDFSPSNTLINKNIQYQATKRITLSKSFTITFVYVKSVSFSLSLTPSNTFLMSYFEDQNTYSMINSQTEIAKYYPYIIRYYSPSFLYTVISLTLDLHKARISPEQLIGVVCGSASVFFLVLAIIIFIVRRKQYIPSSEGFDISDDDYSTDMINKTQQEEDLQTSKDMTIKTQQDDIPYFDSSETI